MKRTVAGLTGCALLLAGCGNAGHSSPTTSAPARPSHKSVPASTPSRTPAGSEPAPTVTAEAACPLLDARTAAENVGVRIGRVTVQSTNGKAVGCRFYADQDPTYRTSEHLPGANQPVLQIVSSHYGGTTLAHNAMVRLAEAGTNAYQSNLSRAVEGISFQTRFDPADGNQDWAYTFRKGTTVVVVSTAQKDTAFDARAVASSIADRF